MEKEKNLSDTESSIHLVVDRMRMLGTYLNERKLYVEIKRV
jgi:hypothetical protein